MGLVESILQRLFPPAAETIAEVRIGRRCLLRGRVIPRDVIDSTLTGEPCVYYRWTIQEWRRSVVHGISQSGFWVKVDGEEAIAEFYLQDETGRAIVSPVRAVVELDGDGAPVKVGMLNREGLEARIKVGDLIEVEGVPERIDDLYDEARGYREHPCRVLIRAPDGGVLRIRLVR